MLFHESRIVGQRDMATHQYNSNFTAAVLQPTDIKDTLLGTPICSLSLEELEEQVHIEKPWLRQKGACKLTDRLLLAAAERAAQTEARFANAALIKGRKAARACHAAARAKEEQALQAEVAADMAPSNASLAAAAATARAAFEEATAAAAAAEDKAKHLEEQAALMQQAVLFFWNGEIEPEANESTGPRHFGHLSRGGRSQLDPAAPMFSDRISGNHESGESKAVKSYEC